MATKDKDESKELRTNMITNEVDPLARRRVDTDVSHKDQAGESAFGNLSQEGSFAALPESGKQALRAFGALDKNDDRYQSARQAALDAIRDAKAAGLFGTQNLTTPVEIAESKDPAVRNQAPTGTQGEMAPPVTGIAPANPGVPEANTSTPAVKGNKP